MWILCMDCWSVPYFYFEAGRMKLRMYPGFSARALP
jgi:hypothetical protein